MRVRKTCFRHWPKPVSKNRAVQPLQQLHYKRICNFADRLLALVHLQGRRPGQTGPARRGPLYRGGGGAFTERGKQTDGGAQKVSGNTFQVVRRAA